MNTQMQNPAGESSPSSNPGAWEVLRGLFRQRSFAVAAAVLLVAALGLNASVQFLQLHFKKQAVPLRQALKQGMPEIMGNWVQVARDETLNADMIDALDTDEYLFCYYVDARKVGRAPEALHREFAALPLADQRARAVQLLQEYRGSVVSLGLTYYTGAADTVAHIPERCYLADGYQVKEQGDVVWPINGRGVEARYISFENADRQGGPDCHVAYFFHVNGRYESKPLAVRMALQNLFTRYGYYAKVELRTDLIDRAESETVMRDFLAAALPHAEKALPDWSEYQDRR